MANTALNRTGVALLTNKSGGSVAQGDVVIVDTANASAFTTTTTGAFVNGQIGVVLEPNGIANNAPGLVAFSGWIPKINLNTAATIGQLLKTHTVAKQATPHSAPLVAGDFAIALEASATPKALLFGFVNQGGGAGTALAFDKKQRTSGNISFTNTSFAVLDTGLNITITTGARRCRITVTGVGYHDNSSVFCVDVEVDGTRLGGTYGLVDPHSATQNRNISFSIVTDLLTSGSHTFKLMGRVDANTGTIYASSSRPLTFSVEEMADTV